MNPSSNRPAVEVIAGTRPEAIKVAPLVKALRARWASAVDTRVVATSQHPTMVAEGLGYFGVAPDDQFDLVRSNERIAGLAAPLTALFDERFARTMPTAVVVQGDTTSALVAAQVAHWHGAEVFHLEAGLRTGDLGQPFPEEANRRGIAALASLHLAPTVTAADNLVREGVSSEAIIVTGNTVVDALCEVVGRDRVWPHRRVPDLPSGPVVVTVHRRESWGEPLRQVCRAVAELAARHPEVPVVWPVHPGSQVDAVVRAEVPAGSTITLEKPLPYPEMMRLLSGARLVLTDSGGLQEESAALGVPAMVLRDRTERPEGVDLGAAILVGTDPEVITDSVDRLLRDHRAWRAMAAAGCPYGDGRAAARSARAIVDYLGQIGGRRLSTKEAPGRLEPLTEPPAAAPVRHHRILSA